MRSRPQAGWWTAVAVCSLAAVAGPERAAAQGFGLNEIGSCAIARGFATTGAPCVDASVIYWNPAAATTLQGLSAYGGITGIQVKGSFVRDTTRRKYEGDVPIEFPPFLGVNWKGSGTGLAGRLALGVAAYVPYGLTSQWEEDFIGRFSAQKASLQTIYVQPNIAFEVVPGRVSIGGGPVFGHSSLELRQGLDFSQQLAPAPAPPGTRFSQLGFAPFTEFGRAQIEGSATAFGYHVGLFVQASKTLTLGARYLSEIGFEYEEGDATFEISPEAATYVLPANNALGVPAGTTLAQVVAPQFQAGGALAPGQTASTRIDHPAQLQVGLGYTGIPRTTLSADYALVRWTSFKELPVDFGATSPLSRTLLEDYDDSQSFRFGAEYRYDSGVALRGGYSFAQSPAPDETVTPLLPDMDRHNFSAGVGIPFARRYMLDLAVLRVETEGRRGRVLERPETLTPEQTVSQLNNGFYGLNANIFSLSLRAQF